MNQNEYNIRSLKKREIVRVEMKFQTRELLRVFKEQKEIETWDEAIKMLLVDYNYFINSNNAVDKTDSKRVGE